MAIQGGPTSEDSGPVARRVGAIVAVPAATAMASGARSIVGYVNASDMTYLRRACEPRVGRRYQANAHANLQTRHQGESESPSSRPQRPIMRASPRRIPFAVTP